MQLAEVLSGQCSSDGAEEENPGWSIKQNTGLEIMGSGCWINVKAKPKSLFLKQEILISRQPPTKPLSSHRD